MIKKIATAIFALSMTATSAFSFLSASADSKVEHSGVMVKIDVQGYMANEWLAEHDEFDITFEHDGKNTYGFFNKDNNFELEVELEVGTEYNVSFSDDFDGYVVSGFEDTFTPEKDDKVVMVTVLPTNEKKDDTVSDTLSKLAMDDEELSEYRKQRDLVQQFVDLTEEYGLYDDTNPYWQALSEEEKKAIFESCYGVRSYCKITDSREEYADIYNAKYDEADSDTLRKHFAFEFLYARYYLFCYDSYHSSAEFKEMYIMGTKATTNMGHYLANYDSIIEPMVDYYKSYVDKYDEMPDFYAVYLDIINGVELEDDSDVTPTVDSKDEVLSSQESIKSDESEILSETEMSSESDTSSDEIREVTKPKSTVFDALKNNIFTIILAIVLGGALLYIRKLKKNGKKKNNDY